MLKGLAGDLEVSRNKTHVFFEAPGLRFMGRLIEGKFPDIDQVVPRTFSRTVLAKAPELGMAIRRIQALALDRSSSIKVQVQPGSLEISAKTADVGAGKISVPAELKGEPIEVSYNAKYLVEALALFRGPVQINITDKVGPTKLVGLPSEGWALVMPMRI